jgi:hypothetical protein
MEGITGEQVERYITEDLNSDVRHDCGNLAAALNDSAHELDCEVIDLMQLLLENKAIDSMHTHSYGFQTANGRNIIDIITDKYFEYEH